MGHVLVMALVVVVLGAVSFAGYTVAHKNSPKASTKTTTTTAGSEKNATDAGCLTTYHDVNLCKFAAHANIDKTAYKATLTVSNAQSTGNMTLESDGKGNTSSTLTGNGQTVSTIMLGGTSYMRLAESGVWYEYPAGSSTPGSGSNPASGMNLVLGAGITYKPLGTEACGSLTCFKYQVTDTATPTTTQYAWFDNKTYLLREWKAVSTNADQGTVDMKLTYPGSVTISKPSPVQPFTAQ